VARLRSLLGPDVVGRFGRYGGLAIVLFGFVLRARGLSEYWLNPDEGIYYSTLTRGSFSAFWAEVLANAHPPGFYLMLRGLGYLTWDFVWLRGSSVLFGTGAIAAFYVLGRALGGPGVRGVVTGLGAAALLGFSPEAIVLSQVLRPYMLVVFLLATATACLLRYLALPEPDREGSPRLLATYAGALCAAAMSHYSAAFGLAVLSGLIAFEVVGGNLRGVPLRRIVIAHAVPSTLMVILYAWHLRASLGSELMGQALGPGGWLSEWLIDSPEAAWRSFVTFQNFHVPPWLRVRSGLLLLAAVAVSATARDKTVAVLAGSALILAIGGSVSGIYPFGPSRHNAWLVVFTIPALAWLGGWIVGSGGRQAAVRALVLIVALGAGTALEHPLGGPEARAVAVSTNATGERVIRRADLAPLIVRWLTPEEGPELVIMTEQSYNVLMPLFTLDRETTVFSADSAVSTFAYGPRRVVVARSWDWDDPRHVARVVGGLRTAIPELVGPDVDRVLVVAGGWGSELVADVPALVANQIVIDQGWAVGVDAAGTVVPRMAALFMDRARLVAAYGPPGA